MMKPLAPLLALMLLAHAATAQSFDVGSLTPTLTFPDTAPGGNRVTRDTRNPGN